MSLTYRTCVARTSINLQKKTAMYVQNWERKQEMRFHHIFKRNEIQPITLKILQYMMLDVRGDQTKDKSLARKETVIPMGKDKFRWPS